MKKSKYKNRYAFEVRERKEPDSSGLEFTKSLPKEWGPFSYLGLLTRFLDNYEPNDRQPDHAD